MRRALSSLLGNDKARFLVAGTSTTALSYAIYLVLLYGGLRPETAYVISYLTGYVWSYFVTSTWVFRAPLSWASFMRYPLVYLLQAVTAFLLFKLLVRWAGIPAALAPLVVILLTVPLTYLTSRAIIQKRASPAKQPNPTSQTEYREQ